MAQVMPENAQRPTMTFPVFATTPSLTPDLAWQTLATVADPEIPVVSVTELGIVRDVAVAGERVQVVVTPTYSGCPATEMINDEIRKALLAAGFAEVDVTISLAPAWTSDWIGTEARAKLRQYGIVPPGHHHLDDAGGKVQPLRFHRKNLACPRCGSTDTEELSAFGSTACKALHRCKACKEPFEYFKPI